MERGRDRGTPLHVAIVHGVDGIHYVAAADSAAVLTTELALYVERQAGMQLYAEDARAVRQMLSGGEADRAVRFYFDRVGVRWDREWLTKDVVTVARGRCGRGDIIPLFGPGSQVHESLHAAQEHTRG